jgi:hypothetical protein
MSRSLLSRLVLPVVLGSFLTGACSGGSAPAADFRGDVACQSAAAVESGTSCELSVSMHGHTYLLRCDFSQGSCDCLRDGRTIPGASHFGGSAPQCTLAFFDLEWSDCCGTPE